MIVPILTCGDHVVSEFDPGSPQPVATFCGFLPFDPVMQTPVAIGEMNPNRHLCGKCLSGYNDRVARLFPGLSELSR